MYFMDGPLPRKMSKTVNVPPSQWTSEWILLYVKLQIHLNSWLICTSKTYNKEIPAKNTTHGNTDNNWFVKKKYQQNKLRYVSPQEELYK